MKSNYKPLGKYIQPVVGRNSDLGDLPLIGLSIQKKFITSIANTIGTDMSTYRIIEKNQFAYGPVTSRNGDKITIALFQEFEKALISQAYIPFEVKDSNELDPEYLMMWFCRPEFDRYARFKSHGSAREIFDWEEMKNTLLPVPHPDKQREIVKEYNVIQDRIAQNQQLIQKLEETAQAIYREWFVEGIDLENLPDGWRIEKMDKFTKMKYGKMLDSELFLEKGYPVFSGYGVRGYYSEYMYKEPQILVLCRGVSGTGEVRLSPRYAYITNLSIVVEVDKPTVSKMYLYYYLRNSDLKSLDSGSAQSMITTGDLYFQDALLPPSDLQMKFDKVANSIMIEIENKNNENIKLMELKDLLLSKLATVE
ncbi:MAG: restriction endonuclease subunit S [Saprospiraceae bacterium]|nr:restriction endonuclease subunit S [Saprospiraceae bacterium]